MIKLKPKTALMTTNLNLDTLNLPNIDLHIEQQKSEPESKIKVFTKKAQSNSNSLF